MHQEQRELIAEFQRGAISRRAFLRRAMATGLAAPIVVSLLATGPAALAQTPATSGPQPSAPRPAGTPAADDKQVLRVATATPFFMDPQTNQAGLWALQSVVFMALARVDATNKPVPGVADSWKSNTDQSSWTFKLNPNAKFSDGTPITADDVKWTWEWYANPKSKSIGADRVVNTVKGFDDMQSGKATTLAGIVVEDPHTITFNLTGTDPVFLGKAATYSTGVLKRDNVEKGGDDWWRAPVTSGMFKVTKYTPGDAGKMTLERNEHWWREPAKLSRVEYQVVADAQTQLVMYDNNQVDQVTAGASDFAQAVKPGGPRHDDLFWAPVQSTYYFGFFCDKAPFDDVKVRQAFASAVDRQAISTSVLGGMYPPQPRILPPGFTCGGDEEFQPTYDPTKAKQLLAASSYGGPDKLPAVTILVSEPASATAPGIWSQMAEAIQQQLQQNLGVKSNVLRKVYGTLAEVQSDARAIDGGVIFRLSFGVAIYDPIYMANIVQTGSSGNATAYSNPEVDKLLQQAAVETDEAKRCELYTEVDKTVSGDAIFLAPFRGSAAAFFKPPVRGIQPVLGSFDASVDKIFIAQ